MRRAVLIRSVQRLLGDGNQVTDVVFMWSRHRLMVPFALGAFLGMLIVAELAGFDEWASRIALGIAAAAIAVTATTNYRVLAQTREGLMLFEASKVRQYAKRLIEQLPERPEIVATSGTVVSSDWRIAGRTYTVPKSSEQAINRLANR